MKKLFTHIRKFLDADFRQKTEDDLFLAESTDLADLERRLHILENRHTQRSLTNALTTSYHL